MRAADMIPAVYGGGRYLRRWSLIGGHPRCILAPLVLAAAGSAAIAATEAENARLHADLAAVEALEDALRLTAGGEAPPELPPVNGEAQPNPALDAWRAALALIQGASDATRGLAEQRASDAASDVVTIALVDPEGLVVNVVAVDQGWRPPEPLIAVPATEEAVAGGTYAAGVFTPPPPVLPVPAEVTLRQLLFALVALGWISEAEALAAARTGDLPASLVEMLPGMTEAEQFAMRLTWAAMYSAERASPIWDIFLVAGVATAAQVDEVFRVAADVGA